MGKVLPALRERSASAQFVPATSGTDTDVTSRFTLKMRNGFSLPFKFAGGSSSTSKRLPSLLSVVSLTMICPASAMPQRRADVFAVSPMTVYESAFELPM